MAFSDKKYLDYEGLQRYDELLKASLPVPDGTSIKIINGKWVATSATDIDVDTTNEVMTINYLASVPAVSADEKIIF